MILWTFAPIDNTLRKKPTSIADRQYHRTMTRIYAVYLPLDAHYRSYLPFGLELVSLFKAMRVFAGNHKTYKLSLYESIKCIFLHLSRYAKWFGKKKKKNIHFTSLSQPSPIPSQSEQICPCFEAGAVLDFVLVAAYVFSSIKAYTVNPSP